MTHHVDNTNGPFAVLPHQLYSTRPRRVKATGANKVSRYRRQKPLLPVTREPTPPKTLNDLIDLDMLGAAMELITKDPIKAAASNNNEPPLPYLLSKLTPDTVDKWGQFINKLVPIVKGEINAKYKKKTAMYYAIQNRLTNLATQLEGEGARQ